LSFEAATMRLGGNVISTENASQFSSAQKGETLEDTIRIVSLYCDAIVLRHPMIGAAEIAANNSRVPIINAGDGSGEHPTQALLDFYTITREKNKDGNHYCLVGDLRHGRTIHSLIYLLGLYEDVHLTLVSPPELSLPDDVKDYIVNSGMYYREIDNFTAALDSGPDVVYMTRVQSERGASEELAMSYCLDNNRLRCLKDDAIIMHPLPRKQELPQEIDGDPRCVYFKQAENGLWMRAGLLVELLK
jgi:aspartate carbamoyltransferase catalytic subunit